MNASNSQLQTIWDFYNLAVKERDEVWQAVTHDFRDTDFQIDLTFWRGEISLTKPVVKKSIILRMPDGETSVSLRRLQPTEGRAEFETAYYKAKAAARKISEVHLVPKIDAACDAHAALLKEAAQAVENSSYKLFSLAAHGVTLSDLSGELEGLASVAPTESAKVVSFAASPTAILRCPVFSTDEKTPEAERLRFQQVQGSWNAIWDERLTIFRKVFPWIQSEILEIAGLPADTKLGPEGNSKDLRAFVKVGNSYEQGTRSGCNRIRAIHERQNKEWTEMTGLPPLGDRKAWRAAAIAAGVTSSEFDSHELRWTAERITAWVLGKLAVVKRPEATTGTNGPRLDEEHQSFVFARSGSGYFVAGFGESGHIKNLKGCGILAALLAMPKMPIAMSKLMSVGDGKNNVGKLATGGGVQDCEAAAMLESKDGQEGGLNKKRSRQEAIDEEGLQSMKKKLEELYIDQAEESASGDVVALQEITTEIEKIENAIKEAAGLGGEVRDINNEADKLRPTIHGNLKRAYTALRAAHPSMEQIAEHLECAIGSQGDTFIYTPAKEINWESTLPKN